MDANLKTFVKVVLEDRKNCLEKLISAHRRAAWADFLNRHLAHCYIVYQSQVLSFFKAHYQFYSKTLLGKQITISVDTMDDHIRATVDGDETLSYKLDIAIIEELETLAEDAWRAARQTVNMEILHMDENQFATVEIPTGFFR